MESLTELEIFIADALWNKAPEDNLHHYEYCCAIASFLVGELATPKVITALINEAKSRGRMWDEDVTDS